jgi:hypothetical protein
MPIFFKAPKRSFNSYTDEDRQALNSLTDELVEHRERLQTLDSLWQSSAIAAMVSSPLAHMRLPLAGKICTLAMCTVWGSLAMRYERHQMLLAQSTVTRSWLDWALLDKQVKQKLSSQTQVEYLRAAKELTFVSGLHELTKNWPDQLKDDPSPPFEALRKIDKDRLPFNLTPLDKDVATKVHQASLDYVNYLSKGLAESSEILFSWFKVWQKVSGERSELNKDSEHENSNRARKG